MPAERSIEEASLAGSVRGLGVCDALRLELVPAQRSQLARQVEALRAPLVEEIRRRGAGDARGAERLQAARYELRLVERLRERVPAGDLAEPFAFIGPATMVGAIARAGMRGAVAALAELVEDERRGGEARARLAHAAAAATAWVQTFLEAQALEDYAFDPEADPDRPW